MALFFPGKRSAEEAGQCAEGPRRAPASSATDAGGGQAEGRIDTEEPTAGGELSACRPHGAGQSAGLERHTTADQRSASPGRPGGHLHQQAQARD